MKKKQTLTLRLITVKEFENFFQVDSPGWYIAKEANAAGEFGSALEAMEAVCLLNKLYMVLLEERMLKALQPFGEDKARDYYILSREDPDEASKVAVGLLGQERSKAILTEVAQATRAEAKIGQNDKGKRAPRR
jgi:hypothetical protein